MIQDEQIAKLNQIEQLAGELSAWLEAQTLYAPMYAPMDPAKAWELSLLALTVWREARNQGSVGMMAVAWTVWNRVEKQSWYGKTWTEVLLWPWQYSANNENDVNARILPRTAQDMASWTLALNAATCAYYDAAGTNPVGKATHYYEKHMTQLPNWVNAPGTVFVVEIGDHRFYMAA